MDSDVGRELRDLFDQIAPPVDGRRIARTVKPRRQVGSGWQIGLIAGLAVLIAGAVTLVFRPDNPIGITPVADATSMPPITATPPNETTTSIDETTTTATETPPVTVERQLIEPAFVNCSAELEGFPCQFLIDGWLESEWQTSNGGIGAQFSFAFGHPIRITEIGFTNLPQDERFLRNANIKGVEVIVDDLPQASIAELADDNSTTQWITINSIRTSVLTITVTSAYPGVSVADREPFTELALAEISFRGSEVIPGTETDALPMLPYLALDVAGLEVGLAEDIFSSCTKGGRLATMRSSRYYRADTHPTVILSLDTIMTWCGESVPDSPADLGPPADPPNVVDLGQIEVMGTQGRVIDEQGVYSVFWILSDRATAQLQVFPTPDGEVTLDEVITIADGIVELTAEQWIALIRVFIEPLTTTTTP